MRAIRVPHGMWRDALAFRFDVGGRSVTFAGDTAPSEALVEAAQGSDILVHEAYIARRAAQEDRPGGEVWPQHLRESQRPTSNWDA